MSAQLALKARDGPVVTQTLSNLSGTTTAFVTLGQGPEPTASAPSANTATADMAPTYTAAGGSNSSDLSQDQIGAILGSIVAFVVILLIIWFCINGGSRPRRSEHRYWAGSYDSSTSSDPSESSSESSRGRGGPRGGPRGVPRDDPWRNRRRGPPPPHARPVFGGPPPPQPFQTRGPTLNPAPPRFPPAPRQAAYTQTAAPQIRGVRRFP